MGRLSRKKTSSKKKKKKAASSSTEGAVSQKLTSSPAASMKEAKKMQVVSQKKPSGVAKASHGKLKQNFIGKAIQFLREVKVELKKVTWPSRKQTIGSTVVVIILVMIISLFLGVVDMGLSGLVRVVLQ